MKTSDLTRRGFLGATSAAALTIGWGGPAQALNDAQAKSLINKVVVDINKVIASGQPLQRMIRDFEKIFKRYGDVPIIARSALGPDARRISASQLNKYVAAFRGYISRKYGKRFNEFVGGRVDVKDSRKVKSFFEVRTVVTLKGMEPFGVNFLVSDKSGKNLFFDMIIEGISLRLSEKAEIGAMLDRRKGNIDALIADLKKAG